MSTIGPIPRNLQPRILKSLAQSFTHRGNPYGNSNPNIAFQRDLDEAMEADDEYRTNASLPRLCHLLAELAYKWEKIESQSRRMSGSTSTQSSDTRKKTSSSDRDRDRDRVQPNPISDTYCMGCNRPGHTRQDCQISIARDLGMDARPIGNSRPEARQATRSSCQEDFEPMVQ